MPRKYTKKIVKKEEPKKEKVAKRVDYFVDDLLHKVDLGLSNTICAECIYCVRKDYIKLKELENDQFTKKKEKKCLIERIEDDLESRLEFINSDTWRILTTISSVTAMVELKKWKKLVDGLFSRVPFNKWRKLVDLGTNDDVEKFLKNIL